jgi:hypothetical protein
MIIFIHAQTEEIDLERDRISDIMVKMDGGTSITVQELIKRLHQGQTALSSESLKSFINEGVSRGWLKRYCECGNPDAYRIKAERAPRTPRIQFFWSQV